MKLCTKPFNSIYITDQEVKLCPWMDIAVDSVLDRPIEEIWGSERAEKIRDSIRDGSFRYCRKEECPLCASDELEDYPDEEVRDYQRTDDIEIINVSYDIFCNHSCPSCRPCVFKPDEDYTERMERLKEWVLPIANRAKRISTCGRGDCFSSPYIRAFLRELKPIREDATIHFETNGALIDKEHWDEIEHLHKYNIVFSVTPNSFDRYTYRYLSGGHDNLVKTVENLKFLSQLRRENKVKEIRVNMVVQESNYREIPSFIHSCLSEFEVDIIQIKPINFWFFMKEEDYWFKNVLNPLHPYHKDYLEVMSDPIVKHEKVRDWTSLSHDRVPLRHPAYRNVSYLEWTSALLMKESPTKYIKKVLEEKKICNMAIYGVGMMGRLFYKLCAYSEVRIPYFIDKWNYQDQCDGLMVKALYGEDFADVDVIVVSAIAFFDEIAKELRTEGYQGEIISLSDF